MERPVEKVTNYLREQKVAYELFQHDEVYTALEIAAAQHVPGKQMVKSVVVKGPDGYMMVVLPAIHLIDFEKLKEVTGLRDITMASEHEVGELFPDCEMGAEPPFGNWAGIPVYCDEILLEDDQIVFNAGTHRETVKIAFSDFERVVKPKICQLGVHV